MDFVHDQLATGRRLRVVSASGRLFWFWDQAFMSVRENRKRSPLRLRLISHPITASYGFRGGREMYA
jgi:hypothetical protein